jgi:hypothetical protein
MKTFITLVLLFIVNCSIEFNFDTDFFPTYSLNLNQVFKNGNVSITLKSLDRFSVFNYHEYQHLNFTINYEADGTEAEMFDSVGVMVYYLNI